MLQLGTILYSKGFAITVANTKYNSPNPPNDPNFDFLRIGDGFIRFKTFPGDLLASILLNDNSKAPSWKCFLLLMEQQKALAEVTSCILHYKIMYFSKAVGNQPGTFKHHLVHC